MAESERMKALVCRQLGNPTSTDEHRPLQLSHNHPKPLPKLPASSVRVKVRAAALNFADALQIQGQYQTKPKLPFIPGSEVSGQVIETGSSVRSLKVGDRVCGVTEGGAFAQEVVIRESAVLKLPPEADLEAAAGLPIAFGTAHLALRERARLQSGQTLLVLGAAGGVGIAAVQIAKGLGARVVAVARGQAKVDALRNLGADVVIDSAEKKPESLRKSLKAAAPRGFDVVFDPVGGTAFSEALKCVKWGAHILFIGFASGTIPKVAANIALVKNLTLHGVFWGSYMQHNPRVLQSGLQELVKWLGEDKISILISHRFPLEDAAEAFRVLLSREVIGKVLILPDKHASKL